MDKRLVRKRSEDARRQEVERGSAVAKDAFELPADDPIDPASVYDGEHPHSVYLAIDVSMDGSIHNLIEGPDSAIELPGGGLTGASIDAIWPGEFSDRLREKIKDTIRGRQVRSDEVEDPRSGKFLEFIFVTRGRDRVLMVVRDVSDRRNEINRIQTLAYIDETTGLPNRERLFEQLRKITDMSRLKENRASVMCIEIDQVDLQNAASVTPIQDALLSELASRLTGNLRGANDPNPIDQERYSIAARMNHRQFIIVLPNIEGGNDAVAVAKRISESLQRPIEIDAKQYRVAVHVGIALFPQDGTDPKTLIENAQAAMQDAKTDHSSQYKFHSGTVRLRALQQQDLELELRTALDAEELDVNYMPLVDAQSGKIVTAEALLRWPAAVFGSQPIDRVIALAEKTGLIVSIGEFVMKRGCEQLRRWHDAGHMDLRLAVNLSLQEISRSGIAESVARVLKLFSIDPSFLDLEITEHILFRDAMKDFRTCRDLKNIGVGITVDDYGTGVCSLAHLAQSPVDAVKIDNSLVAGLESGAADRATCAAAAAMARELGYKVIAEGVETDGQANILRSQGCDLLQGYAFSRPLTAGDFGKLLDEKPATLELAPEE